MFSDLSLEAFVAVTAQTLQDLGNIYAGVNYLKHFEGEKHLVFFTERGLTMPRLEEDQALAAAANDARVALDTIETGGLYTDAPSLGATGSTALAARRRGPGIGRSPSRCSGTSRSSPAGCRRSPKTA